MSDLLDLLISILLALLTAFTAVLAWIGRKALDEQKQHSARLGKLEQSAVTREDLDKALEQIRSDRRAMHQENRDYLIRIEQKIDANEERDSKTRHDIRDSVNAVALKVAVLAERSIRGKTTK